MFPFQKIVFKACIFKVKLVFWVFNVFDKIQPVDLVVDKCRFVLSACVLCMCSLFVFSVCVLCYIVCLHCLLEHQTLSTYSYLNEPVGKQHSVYRMLDMMKLWFEYP